MSNTTKYYIPEPTSTDITPEILAKYLGDDKMKAKCPKCGDDKDYRLCACGHCDENLCTKCNDMYLCERCGKAPIIDEHEASKYNYTCKICKDCVHTIEHIKSNKEIKDEDLEFISNKLFEFISENYVSLAENDIENICNCIHSLKH